MIEKVEMFTIICDKCGLNIGESQEYSCWADKGVAEENAMDSDWEKDGDKHFCTNCFTYDKDGEIVLNS